MKTKTILVAALLGFSIASKAQWPAPLNLNTGTNASNTGTLSATSLDNNWMASTVSISSGYVQAEVVNPEPTWYQPPSSSTSAWITYPHNCSGYSTQSESWCTGLTHEEYYKVTVNLTNPGIYSLSWTAYADNCVFAMYLNNTSTPFYSAPVAGGSYYLRSGFSTAVSGVKSTGWVAGTNTIYVHVKSGTTASTGNTGFILNAVGTYTPGDEWIPDPPETCCLGNLCSDSQNALTGDYEIPLNSFNFNFSGTLDDKVNVGYNCGSEGNGKLNSVTAVVTNQTGGSSPESISIYGENYYQGRGTGVGVMGIAKNLTGDGSGGNSVGVWGDAMGEGDNIGGKFFAGTTKQHITPQYNIGVSAVALSSTGNPPAYTYMPVYPGGANIGIYAAGDLQNSLDPNNPGQDWAAWFDGDVNIMGNCFWNTTFQFSDKRLKKDIKELENISEKIKKLNGYTYSFRTDAYKERGFDNKSHIGFIAQEVKEVFPELVTEDAKGFYAVDYQGMIPVLLTAAKEQGKTIADQNTQIVKQEEAIRQQQQQIDELKILVQSLAATNTGKNSGMPVTLTDKNAIVLNQNVPNPFAESTLISYNVPSDFTKAQIIFTTNEGKIIKTVDITQKGQGSLTVFANDLSKGIYSYSLVVDGKTIDTKKMIKE